MQGGASPSKTFLSGIDALNIIVHESDVKDREAELTAEIEKVIKPNRLAVTHDIAMIAIVGRELGTSPAIAVKVLGALANRKININLIDHGSEKSTCSSASQAAIISQRFRPFTPSLRAYSDRRKCELWETETVFHNF